MEGRGEGVRREGREDVDGYEGAEGGGEGDSADARADHGRGVPREGGRRARAGGEIEGEDVEEGVGDLEGG